MRHRYQFIKPISIPRLQVRPREGRKAIASILRSLRASSAICLIEQAHLSGAGREGSSRRFESLTAQGKFREARASDLRLTANSRCQSSFLAMTIRLSV
jgi:hypothetical protein